MVRQKLVRKMSFFSLLYIIFYISIVFFLGQSQYTSYFFTSRLILSFRYAFDYHSTFTIVQFQRQPFRGMYSLKYNRGLQSHPDVRYI